MTTETFLPERFCLQDPSPIPTSPDSQPTDETGNDEHPGSSIERIQRVVSSAILGGLALGVIGGVTGGVGLLSPLIASTAFHGALVAGGAGASIGAIRALFFDTPPQEVCLFHSIISGATAGLTAALFAPAPLTSVWELGGAFAGMIEGWTERELRRRLV